MKILDIFAGKKTYLIALALIAYGITGLITGQASVETAEVSILAGLAALTGRRAVDR